jgi:hypothetical protein
MIASQGSRETRHESPRASHTFPGTENLKSKPEARNYET